MPKPAPPIFFGWRVVGAAFVLAAFGWGVGFYGPPVYLHTLVTTRGWPLAMVSAAVTTHYLFGALVVANLPRLYARFGIPAVTKAAAISLGLGVMGWAAAVEPWQLFAATLLSGAGWVAMSAAAINAILAPWFVRRRPAALAMAYNGASVGGVLLAPLWVALIAVLGFPAAALLVGAVMAAVVWVLASVYFARTPAAMGLEADGDAAGEAGAPITAAWARPWTGSSLWRSRRFQTLAAGMALGLFAQIGLVSHLFSLMVPALGAASAGIAMGLVTAAAVAGRSLTGWLMPAGADRRVVAALSYGVQIGGTLLLIWAAGQNVAVMLAGAVLFGLGIGNATSLPPLIAQVEFVKDDVGRVVPLIVAMAQATFAFAPATFGLIRAWQPSVVGVDGDSCVFLAAALVQAGAIAALLGGRRAERG